MSQPLVLAVMLAAGRREMVARSIRSFLAQTYPNKALTILDNGQEPLDLGVVPGKNIYLTRLSLPASGAKSIGTLRNMANGLACAFNAPIIAHFDSDDYSEPRRIEEQVAFLEKSGAPAVGYYDMLFWDTRPHNRQCNNEQCHRNGAHVAGCGEAWLFRSPNKRYCLGTSLLYWRRTWEKHPFPDLNTAEDLVWYNKVKPDAQSSLQDTPRMIACIHGGNTCATIMSEHREWSRMPSFNDYCKAVLA